MRAPVLFGGQAEALQRRGHAVGLIRVRNVGHDGRKGNQVKDGAEKDDEENCGFAAEADASGGEGGSRRRTRKISDYHSNNCPLMTTEIIANAIEKSTLHAKDPDRIEIPRIRYILRSYN